MLCVLILYVSGGTDSLTRQISWKTFSAERSACIENIRLCIDSINDDLRKIDNWANANGLCINPSKSKCLLFSRTKREFDVPDIIIKGNKIDFVESASNLGVMFNGRQKWSSDINVNVGKVYSMLRNLWAVIDWTPFPIRMQLITTFLIPFLLYGSEIFANCDTYDRRKLETIYHNFLTGYLKLILIIY